MRRTHHFLVTTVLLSGTPIFLDPANAAALPVTEIVGDTAGDLAAAGKQALISLALAGQEDVRRLNISRRWAIVLVGVLGEGDATALAAGLHASMVIKTTFAWRGSRWKFVVKSLSPSPGTVQVMSTAVNFASDTTSEILDMFLTLLVPESLVCQAIAVPMQGAEPMWIFFGGRKSASGTVRPIFRVQSGNVESAANTMRELIAATQSGQ